MFPGLESFVGLTDQQLEKLFRQRRNDVLFLERLNQELKKRTSDAAVELQIEVVTLLRSARGRAAPAGVAASQVRSGPVREWLRAYFGARGLWPAAGFVDTEIRCLTELESWNAEKEVQPRVQA